MDKMRDEFEGWARDEYPKMSPCYFEWVNEYSHYAIDEVQFAWEAWQAASAQNVAAIDTSSGHVEKVGGNRHDQPSEHEMKDRRCECCGYMTYQREHLGCIRAAHNAINADEYSEAVGRVRTVGSYPDESAHKVDWLVKYSRLKDGDLLYTAAPAQVPDNDGAQHIANLLKLFSEQFGKNDDAEGLLEFYGRTHYEQGVKDASRQMPDGWQIVPKEPTPQMLEAIDQYGEYYSEESLKDAYKDMLSIAPQPKVGE